MVSEEKMSRIGKMPVEIPEKVKVVITGNIVNVEGPKGKLQQTVKGVEDGIVVEVKDSVINVKRTSEAQSVRALHGLTRAILKNMVEGVSKGYEKTLEIQGVGYKAAMKGKDIELVLGYSHPVLVKAPANVTIACDGATKVKVSGPDKYLVGQVAATIRKAKKPEPYKGKGVRYFGENVRKKTGKTTAA